MRLLKALVMATAIMMMSQAAMANICWDGGNYIVCDNDGPDYDLWKVGKSLTTSEVFACAYFGLSWHLVGWADYTDEGALYINGSNYTETVNVVDNVSDVCDMDYNVYAEKLPSDWFNYIYVMGNSGSNIITGSYRDERIDGGTGPGTLNGMAGDDWIRGNRYGDIIYGGDGDDILEGRDGNDTIYGEDGNDDIEGGPGADWISGGSGDDEIDGGYDGDRIYGNSGNDTIWGGYGRDRLWGNSGGDEIHGDEDNDMLYGGTGDDILWGDAGGDTCDGEAPNPPDPGEDACDCEIESNCETNP